MMRVRDDGSVAEVSGAVNDGLMRVANAGDAKIAAAAIMSLTFGPSGPISISPGEVAVAPMNGGWLCLAHARSGGREGWPGDRLRRRWAMHEGLALVSRSLNGKRSVSTGTSREIGANAHACRGHVRAENAATAHGERGHVHPSNRSEIDARSSILPIFPAETAARGRIVEIEAVDANGCRGISFSPD